MEDDFIQQEYDKMEKLKNDCKERGLVKLANFLDNMFKAKFLRCKGGTYIAAKKELRHKIEHSHDKEERKTLMEILETIKQLHEEDSHAIKEKDVERYK